MSDQPTPPPAPGTDGPEKEKSKRSRSPVPKVLTNAIADATETAATAKKESYAAALAKVGIDAAFVAALAETVDRANILVSAAVGARSDKSTTTDDEENAKDVLEARIGDVQALAKIKYPTPGDPQRKKFYIGQPVGRNRPQLVGAAKSILATLAAEPLPGVSPELLAALKAALDAYMEVQSDQAGEQTDAGTARKRLDVEVEGLKEQRKRILYAVDAVWPSRDSANVPIRREFKVPPNRPLS